MTGTEPAAVVAAAPGRQAANWVTKLVTWSQAFSISTKIMGLAFGMVLLVGLSVGPLAQSGFLRSTSSELELRGQSIAADVAVRGADMLLTHNALGLHELLQGTMQNNADVRYVIILDSHGRVAAHTFGSGFPVDLLDLPAPARGQKVLVQRLSTEEGPLHDIAVPILDGSAGVVRVGMSPQRLRRAAMQLAEWLGLAVLAVAVVAVFAAYVLTKVLTRPILGLVEVARAAGGGDLTRRVPAGPPDELGLMAQTFNAMLDRLQEAQRVKSSLLDRVIGAQEEERRRIARELHDETSQAITSLIVGLRVLEEGHPEVRQSTAELRSLASQTLDEIHGLILELRPRALDELGLVPALRRHVEDFSQKTGIHTEFQVVGGAAAGGVAGTSGAALAGGTGAVGAEDRLPQRIETCVYRIVQEALTNVARHSGAHNASVVLDVRGGSGGPGGRTGQVTAIIEDDGRGFDEAQVGRRSLGIAGMRERVSLLDGTMQIESSPASGTTVFVKIPLGEE